ncbi:GNAT family N-acetyltransferase [Microbacterium sp. BLY]|uniref:GNAT family N-acetyltransferase n=1 Tax=Microbacterium sp. BLY TaxID=2823280 RepID=UPI001B32B138|nr:GNAT family N-acetyltransferase [Microbacterium sp. BLY]MBP3977684.1 GNAT family N-acetyltransferase [Microbacterium sp. BLY]
MHAASARGGVTVREAEWPGDAAFVSAAVSTYLRQTEQEKHDILGDPAEPEGGLPERYRPEVRDPATAYAGGRVLVAEIDGGPVGVVIALPHAGYTEIKRLWADPTVRGRGVGSALLDAVLREAEGAVQLSVWDWRDAAIRLYTSRGFRPVDARDDRDRLLCFESRTSLHPAAEGSEGRDSKG